MSAPPPFLTQLRNRLAPFDALDLAFIFLDPHGTPLYMSSRAAKLLMVRNRNEIDLVAPLLEPVVDFVRSATAGTTTSSGIAKEILRAGQGGRPPQEIDLTTTDDRPLRVLAQCHPMRFPAETEQEGKGGTEGAKSAVPNGNVVILHDLAPYQPLLRMLEQQRRARPLIVLAFAELETSSLTPSVEEVVRLLAARDSAKKKERTGSESGATDQAGAAALPQTKTTDLLALITRAVDIVDSLVVSSHKLTVEVATSALLEIPPVSAVRLISHLLFEAADFSGPFGKTRVKAVMRSGQDDEGSVAQIGIFAQRRWDIPGDASAIERYLYRKSVPVEYRVAVTAESLSGEELTQTETLFAEMSPLEGSGSRNIKVVAEETLSENLRIAVQLGREMHCEIRTALLSQDLLAFSIQIPLVLSKLPGRS